MAHPVPAPDDLPAASGVQLLEETLRPILDRLALQLDVQFQTNPFRGLERRVLLCTSGPRAGSHLLMQRLAGHGVRIDEYFNDGPIERACARRGLGSYEAYCRFRLRTVAANGAFGVKGRPNILAPLWKAGEIPDHFADWSILYLRRTDIVGQAVSEVKAQLDGAWKSAGSPARPLGEARYDAGKIARAIARTLKTEQVWEALFAAFGLGVLRLTYEELAADPDAVARRAAAFARLSGPPLVVKGAPVRAQADDLNARWAARFREENPGLDLRPPPPD